MFIIIHYIPNNSLYNIPKIQRGFNNLVYNIDDVTAAGITNSAMFTGIRPNKIFALTNGT